jgi:hypothetical protein
VFLNEINWTLKEFVSAMFVLVIIFDLHSAGMKSNKGDIFLVISVDI